MHACYQCIHMYIAMSNASFRVHGWTTLLWSLIWAHSLAAHWSLWGGLTLTLVALGISPLGTPPVILWQSGDHLSLPPTLFVSCIFVLSLIYLLPPILLNTCISLTDTVESHVKTIINQISFSMKSLKVPCSMHIIRTTLFSMKRLGCPTVYYMRLHSSYMQCYTVYFHVRMCDAILGYLYMQKRWHWLHHSPSRGWDSLCLPGYCLYWCMVCDHSSLPVHPWPNFWEHISLFLLCFVSTSWMVYIIIQLCYSVLACNK